MSDDAGRMHENPVEIIRIGWPGFGVSGVQNKGFSCPHALAHYNHRARGEESDGDEMFVRDLAERLAIPLSAQGSKNRIPVIPQSIRSDVKRKGFEAFAREARYSFLMGLARKHGPANIIVAHTADDQVETILMRVLEGAGISGLKGIPRNTDDGIRRPLLDTWREDILKFMRGNGIPFRLDKSNCDTRFERNWIRHVLIPLLEKRYGKSVKKRIFALGERFREIDEFLETAARRWMKCNLKEEVDGRSGTWREKSIVGGRLRFQRKPFGKHPSALRKKILQNVCFERVGIAPNERLLESMDRLIASGGASARLNVGKGAVLKCRYEQAIVDMSGMNARTTGENGKDRDVRAGKSAFKGKRLSLEMTARRYGIDDVGQEGLFKRAFPSRYVGRRRRVQQSWSKAACEGGAGRCLPPR